MKLKLICLALFTSWTTAKIFVVESEDLPNLFSSMKPTSRVRNLSQTWTSFSHLEETDDGTSEHKPDEDDEDHVLFYPLTCDYAEETRFGFHVKVEKKDVIMLPDGTADCENPVDLRQKLSHVVVIDKEILKIRSYSKQKEALEKAINEKGECKGLTYKFKRGDEDIETVLHLVSNKEVTIHMPGIVPGYITMESLRTKIFTSENPLDWRPWMGDLVLFCLD